MKRDYVSNWTIDGTPILSPDEVIVEHYDLEHDDSGSDDCGYYHPIVQRTDMLRIELPYSVLTAEEYTYMESLVRGKATVTLNWVDESGTAQICEARCKRSPVNWVNRATGIHKNYKLTFTKL